MLSFIILCAGSTCNFTFFFNTMKNTQGTIGKVKISNMLSLRGNYVPNQFIIQSDKGQYFQSYQSIIALIGKDGQVYLDKGLWDYSSTTSKYRNIFLGEDTKTTKRKIKSGEYKLVSLNQK